MRVTIIKVDNAVGIDGEFLYVDCSALPAAFHALQWDSEEGFGEIEYTGRPKPPNEEIQSLSSYQSYVDAWYAEKARLEAEAAAVSASLDPTTAPAQEGPVIVD